MWKEKIELVIDQVSSLELIHFYTFYFFIAICLQ